MVGPWGRKELDTTEPLTLPLSFSRPLSENNQWEFNGNPKPVLCDNLEGWSGQGGGRGFKRRGQMYACGQSMLVYGKNQKQQQAYIYLSLVLDSL